MAPCLRFVRLSSQFQNRTGQAKLWHPAPGQDIRPSRLGSSADEREPQEFEGSRLAKTAPSALVRCETVAETRLANTLKAPGLPTPRVYAFQFLYGLSTRLALK
jgi:hypothetical protein